MKNRGNFASDYLVVVGLTLLAVLLRFPGLQVPLQGDEAITFNRYGFQSWREILFYYSDTNQHALFSLLSNFCMRLFGESELWFRLPSFLAGVLAVPLLYRLGILMHGGKTASIIAASLLALSSVHLSYSQQGRGYALTVFLALILIFSITAQVRGKNVFIWSAVLVGSGLCLVLTVPSNAYFLAAAAVYSLAAKWDVQEETGRFLDRHLLRIVVSFLILLVFVGGYLYTIRHGLQTGIKEYSFGSLDSAKVRQIGWFLVSPWKPWFYLFFICGLVALGRKEKIIAFLVLLGTPLLLMLATGIVGFPRVYIYGLPFILLVVAWGMVWALSGISRLNRTMGKAAAVILIFVVMAAPARSMAKYYPARDKVLGTMEDAKRVLSYIEEKIPMDHLVVISAGAPQTSVLNHYLKNRVRGGMFNVVRGGDLNKVIFICDRNSPPWDFKFRGYYGGSFINVSQQDLRLLEVIGNLAVFEFAMKASRFLPASYEVDFETFRFSPQLLPELKMEGVKQPKVVGEHALKISKRSHAMPTVVSPIAGVNIKEKNSYLLLVYLRQYKQKSFALLDGEGWLPQVGRLNYLNNLLSNSQTGFEWEMVFALYPTRQGSRRLRLTVNLQDDISYFDGLQSFLLTPLHEPVKTPAG